MTYVVYAIHTYEVLPGALAVAEKQFADELSAADESRSLVAAWRTEIGPLNRFIHVHGYEVPPAAGESRIPPKTTPRSNAASREWITEQGIRLMAPLSFSPPPMQGDCGPYYEIRSYRFRAEDLGEIESSWAARIEERTRTSPVWAVWHSVDDGDSTLLHIWPYRSLEQRADIRRRVGGWSHAQVPGGTPRGNYSFLRQETMIAVPTSYSPVR